MSDTKGTKYDPSGRFYTTAQFHELDGTFNATHAAPTCMFEAMQPGTNLKQFLAKELLFGNKGSMDVIEIKQLALELFVSERAASYHAQLASDGCLGFTPEEVREIIALLSDPYVESARAACAIGYIPPRRHY